MKKRVFSCAVLAVLVALIAVFESKFFWTLHIASALLSLTALYELSGALSLRKKYFLMIPSVLFAAVLPFLFGTVWLGTAVFLYVLLLFTAYLLNHKTVSLKNFFLFAGMSIFIVCSFSLFPALNLLHDTYGLLYVILALFAAWMADVGAFCAGKLFGKHQLAPSISPKKTIEGAIGGLFLNVAVSLLIGFLFEILFPVDVKVLPLILLTVIGTPISIIGDLTFSVIKRDVSIKDYGNLIPGHGGILDRFDSVIFVLPFAYYLFTFLPAL